MVRLTLVFQYWPRSGGALLEGWEGRESDKQHGVAILAALRRGVRRVGSGTKP